MHLILHTWPAYHYENTHPQTHPLNVHVTLWFFKQDIDHGRWFRGEAQTFWFEWRSLQQKGQFILISTLIWLIVKLYMWEPFSVTKSALLKRCWFSGNSVDCIHFRSLFELRNTRETMTERHILRSCFRLKKKLDRSLERWSSLR